jgi:thermitase
MEGKGMKPRAAAALLSVTVVAAVSLSAGMAWLPRAQAREAAAPIAAGGHGEARIVVKFREALGAASRSALHAALGSRVRRHLAALGVDVVDAGDRQRMAEAIRRYEADPRVEYAEPDVRMTASRVPDDPQYPSEWGMDAVSAPAAWDISTGASSTVVAVVDTGIAAHAEFAGRRLKGYDFVNDDADATDDEGHGTSVAGIIGATGDNGAGMAGLDWFGKLLPVKVLDYTGSGWTSDIAAGVTWAADHGARVINMSLGGPGKSSTLKNAVAYAVKKGVVVVAAAGNDATSAPSFPAAYPGVLSVSALDGSDLAYFSDFGPNVDVAAPGLAIRTIGGPTSYDDFSGTSASAPFVSGVASLVVGRNPYLTGSAVSRIVTSSADDLGPAGWDASFGWGRIDAARALRATPLPDTTAPSVSITAPAANAHVKGNVKIKASAADNVGVVRVEFRVGGKLVATYKTAPYQVTWTTAKAGNGWHTISAKAYDAAGNAGTSKSVRVYVSNPPPRAS